MLRSGGTHHTSNKHCAATVSKSVQLHNHHYLCNSNWVTTFVLQGSGSQCHAGLRATHDAVCWQRDSQSAPALKSSETRRKAQTTLLEASPFGRLKKHPLILTPTSRAHTIVFQLAFKLPINNAAIHREPQNPPPALRRTALRGKRGVCLLGGPGEGRK